MSVYTVLGIVLLFVFTKRQYIKHSSYTDIHQCNQNYIKYKHIHNIHFHTIIYAKVNIRKSNNSYMAIARGLFWTQHKESLVWNFIKYFLSLFSILKQFYKVWNVNMWYLLFGCMQKSYRLHNINLGKSLLK